MQGTKHSSIIDLNAKLFGLQKIVHFMLALHIFSSLLPPECDGSTTQNLIIAATYKYQTAHCCVRADELFKCKGDLCFVVLFRVYGILLCDSCVNLCIGDLLHILLFL